MRKPGPQRPKNRIPEGATVEDFARAWFDTLMPEPTVAKALKELAESRGLSLEGLMYEIIADGYRSEGEPLPPELRQSIARHAPRRSDLLKPDVS